MSFEPLHARRTHGFTLPLARDEAFPLFTPEGEKRWADGWAPRYPDGSDGRPRAGLTFTTGEGDAVTLWMMTRHDPGAGLVEYARFTPGSRVATVRVECRPCEGARTRVQVSYSFTGLDDAGNDYIRKMDDAAFRDYVDSWESAIAATL